VVMLMVDRYGRIGLIRSQRCLARDFALYRRQVEAFFRDPPVGLPAAFFENLGSTLYEVPRGLAKVGELLEAAAEREGGEEGGGRIRRVEWLLENIALDSTFFPQQIAAFLVRVDPRKPAAEAPDPLEGILGR